jgi:hypothetical protein
MAGLNVPGKIVVGSVTVTTNSPAVVLAVGPIGIRSASPSVAPKSVADVADGPQNTPKVVAVPGADGLGVTLVGSDATTPEVVARLLLAGVRGVPVVVARSVLASAAPVAAVRARTSAPANAAATALMQRTDFPRNVVPRGHQLRFSLALPAQTRSPRSAMRLQRHWPP